MVTIIPTTTRETQKYSHVVPGAPVWLWSRDKIGNGKQVFGMIVSCFSMIETLGDGPWFKTVVLTNGQLRDWDLVERDHGRIWGVVTFAQ